MTKVMTGGKRDKIQQFQQEYHRQQFLIFSFVIILIADGTDLPNFFVLMHS